MTEPCRCECGYTCGGPGVCPVYASSECLQNHFKVDCDHQWDGPDESGEMLGGGFFSTSTCSKCGISSMAHDMRAGP